MNEFAIFVSGCAIGAVMTILFLLFIAGAYAGRKDDEGK